MTNVVHMLTGEKDADEITVTKPGLISDLMGLKNRSNDKPKLGIDLTSSNYNSSGSDNLDNTAFTSAPSSQATTTFIHRSS